MTTDLTTYRACGYQAGRALRAKQHHLARYFNYWLLRAMMLESETNRRLARSTFNDALSSQLKP